MRSRLFKQKSTVLHVKNGFVPINGGTWLVQDQRKCGTLTVIPIVKAPATTTK